MHWFGVSDGFDCLTPLGPARCVAFVWDSDDPEWICRIDRTGEIFNFGNNEFRMSASVTNGYPDVSPFDNLNGKTFRQIERYKRSGWL